MGYSCYNRTWRPFNPLLLRFIMRKLLLLTALGFLPLACGQAPKDSGSSETTATHQPSENAIRNFHTVHPYLFRSGEVRNSQVPLLAGLGVTTILSLQDASEKYTAESQGIDFELIAMSGSDKPTYGEIQAALDVISDPARQPVLVHCTYGADRTGIVIAAYRMVHDGWTQAQAKAELHARGHSEALYWWDSALDSFE